jgi:hypothetical protein
MGDRYHFLFLLCLGAGLVAPLSVAAWRISTVMALSGNFGGLKDNDRPAGCSCYK